MERRLFADVLTEREEEVTLLAVKGVTRRGIAERLVISVNTVDTHLRNIYVKLGIHKSAELATVVERRRSADARPVLPAATRSLTLRPAYSGELETVRRIETAAYPDAVTRGDVCFEPEKLRYLMRRFEGAIMILEDNSVALGYLCSYPVDLATAESVIAGSDIEPNLPGTRGDNPLFPLDHVLPLTQPSDVAAYAWYFDSLAVPFKKSDKDVLHLFIKATSWLKGWLPHIRLLLAITDREEGEELVEIASDWLSQRGLAGFGSEPVWTRQTKSSSPKPWKCWVARLP